jgi:hypothetical protein
MPTTMAVSFRLIVFLLPRGDLILSPPINMNQHPADILCDLEQEALVLKRLRARVAEQVGSDIGD